MPILWLSVMFEKIIIELQKIKKDISAIKFILYIRINTEYKIYNTNK